MRSQSAVSHFGLTTLLLVLGAVACGNDEQHRSAGDAGETGSDEPAATALGTCGLRTEVSGGTDIEFTGNDDAACSTLLSTDDGLDVIFTGIDAKGSLELLIDRVVEGGLGEFPARIVVTSTTRANWQGEDCTASVSEHQLVRTEASTLGERRHYQVSGDGSCRAPLNSIPAGSAAVTVGPFAFRAQFTWSD